MANDSNKMIKAVCREVLKPLGFHRMSDRLWSYDGGWWLLHVSFQASSYNKGCYTELGVQPLADWRSHVTLGYVRSSRTFVEFSGDDEAYAKSLRRCLDALLPVALGIVQEVSGPGDLLKHPSVDLPKSTFRTGMLLGLAGRAQEAGVVFDSVRARSETGTWEIVESEHCAAARRLLSDTPAFHEFANLLILRTRVSVGELAEVRPLACPWL